MLPQPTNLAGQIKANQQVNRVFSASTSTKCQRNRRCSVSSVAEPVLGTPAAHVVPVDHNQLVREGHYEAPLVREQVGCEASALAGLRVQTHSSHSSSTVTDNVPTHYSSTCIGPGICWHCALLWLLSQ